MELLLVLSFICFQIPMSLIFKRDENLSESFRMIRKKSKDGFLLGDSDFKEGRNYWLLANLSSYGLSVLPLIGLIPLYFLLVIIINTIIAFFLPFILGLILPLEWAYYYKIIERNIIISIICGLALYFIALSI